MSCKTAKSVYPFLRFDTDEAAESFVETADRSEYDFSGFRPTRFEFEPEPKAEVDR